MKPLTLEETRLKEEMKHDCFWDNIHYKNPEAEKAFNLICHLEDFEVQYWELQQENKKLNGVIQTYDILLKTNAEENKRLKDNWNKLREWIVYNKHNEDTEQHYLVVDYGTLLGKMKELQGSE